jgi:hypothetical protein
MAAMAATVAVGLAAEPERHLLLRRGRERLELVAVVAAAIQ